MSDAPLRRHGVADTKEIAETEGRQIFQTMIDGMLPGRRWRKLSLSNFVKVGDGVAAFQGGPDEAFLNPMGGPRPRGWALTPVDSVAHCAATTLLPVGTGDTTIETKVNFSHPQGILEGPRAVVDCIARRSHIFGRGSNRRRERPPARARNHLDGAWRRRPEHT
jgi:acyl-coenzyme A thioesterase PaaI-like protein